MMTLRDRALQYVDNTVGPGECWEWQGSRDKANYGRLNVDGIPRPAHRVMYELTFGPIPDGLELDHLCVNPPCVMPLHLEPVTHAENHRRRRKVACSKGHMFTPETTYTKADGSRECATCSRRRARDRKRAAR